MRRGIKPIYSDKFMRKIVRQYANDPNLALRSFKKKYGVSHWTVSLACKKYGVPCRPPGSKKKSVDRKFLLKKIDLCKSGVLRKKDVAESLNVSICTLNKLFAELGAPAHCGYGRRAAPYRNEILKLHKKHKNAALVAQLLDLPYLGVLREIKLANASA